MKISIIGSNSYIARNFICQLDKSRFSYCLYDIHETHFDGCGNYQKIDLSSKKNISSNIDFDVDAIYIFSGKTGTKAGFDEYEKYIDVNEKYLLNILTCCAEVKTKARIVYPSSRLVYKSSEYPVNEESNLDGKSIYAITKIASENYIRLYSTVFGLSYNIFRICVPFGSLIQDVKFYGTYEFFLSQAKSGKNITLFGDGSSERTFTYIGDICKVLLDVPLMSISENEIYNIGGDNRSLLDIARVIATYFNVGVDFIEWPIVDKRIEVPTIKFNFAKLNEIYPYKYHMLGDCVMQTINP